VGGYVPLQPPGRKQKNQGHDDFFRMLDVQMRKGEEFRRFPPAGADDGYRT
jgi:hypothetical protein